MTEKWRMADGGWQMDFARGAGASRIPHPASLVLCFGLIVPGVAPAQAVNDPTRPPAGLGAGVAEADFQDSGGGMMLQSVLISPAGRSAIISGVMVKLGEKYGDAVLVRVAENEVVLKSGTESQVLKLYPGVDKRVATQGVPRKGKARGGAAEEKGK